MKTPAQNPFLPSWEYIPDGEPYVFRERVYIYGSHDRFGGEAFCMNDYRCWSAPVDDLGAWQDEGILYKKDQDPLNQNGQQYLYAPDLQKGPDGRYYLYYALHRTPVISVAVCDTPGGAYQFYGHVRFPDGHVWGTLPGEVQNFDPGVFLDDDGKVYLYSGFSPFGELEERMKPLNRQMDGGYCVQLAPDMLTIQSGPSLLVPGTRKSLGSSFAGHAFFEASSMRKIGDRYYFVYSSEKSHELCYATSSRPDRDFVYGGTLVSIGDIGLNGNQEPVNYLGNTHGGLVEILGKWYIFYHRQTNRHMFSRQACAQEITLLPNGAFVQAEITSCGLNGGPLPAKGTYQARIACNLSSGSGACMSLFSSEQEGLAHPAFTQSEGDREQDPDQYISRLQRGAWAGFKYFLFSGERNIALCVRGDAEGTIEVATQRGGAPVATVPIVPSKEWAWYSAPLTSLRGIQPLYFSCDLEGALDFLAFQIQ